MAYRPQVAQAATVFGTQALDTEWKGTPAMGARTGGEERRAGAVLKVWPCGSFEGSCWQIQVLSYPGGNGIW